jgi:hypothetical protein
VIPTLHTGSWINADFGIWIGHPEDNRGWELLGRTRDLLQLKIDRGELSADQREKAMNEIYAAEGSDWFWWYGDDFVTDNDLLFDELFRTHLQNVYQILGVPVPETLKTAICRSESAHEMRPPTELITPQVDGLVTSYYEWIGAGVYEAGRSMGAMYQAERFIESVHFGGNLQQFALRVDFRGDVGELPGNLSLSINFEEPVYRALVVPYLAVGVSHAELFDAANNDRKVKVAETTDVCLSRILELTIPYSTLGWQARQAGRFFVQVLRDEIELERHPSVGTLSFVVPDEQFEVENWRV